MQVNNAVPNVFQNIGNPILWKRLDANDWYVVTDVMGLRQYKGRNPAT